MTAKDTHSQIHKVVAMVATLLQFQWYNNNNNNKQSVYEIWDCERENESLLGVEIGLRIWKRNWNCHWNCMRSTAKNDYAILRAYALSCIINLSHSLTNSQCLYLAIRWLFGSARTIKWMVLLAYALCFMMMMMKKISNLQNVKP